MDQAFKLPSQNQINEALGDLKQADPATRIALSNISEYWVTLRAPKNHEWLSSYPKDGWQTFQAFGGKIINPFKNVLYIQPLLYKENSAITKNLLDGLNIWLQAFFQGCTVVVLPTIYECDLDKKQLELRSRERGDDPHQYHAIDLIKKVIAPIQQSKPDAIGVISFTDVDLYTTNLSNYCFGYGMACGGIQSLHRFTADFTGEQFESKQKEELMMLFRTCKIATHEIGHMFFLGHCTYYECLMKGTNHLEQTDQHPIYFCPVCYRKLHKCIKFDHLARYAKIIKVCVTLSGPFIEDKKNGCKKWFDKRLFDLSKNLKEIPQNIIESNPQKQRDNSLRKIQASPKNLIGIQRSNSNGKQNLKKQI